MKVMKKNALVFLLVLFCKLLAAQIQESISFEMSDFSFESAGEFVRISHAGQTYTYDIGCPEMPRIEIRFAVPYDNYVSGLTVTDSTVQMVNDSFLIFPKQPDICVGNPNSSFVIDTTSYNSDLPYPGSYIEIADQFKEMGYHIIVINVYPFSYIPLEHKLSFCSSISFTLQYSRDGNSPSLPKLVSRPMFELAKTIIKSEVKNHSDIDAFPVGSMRIVETNERIADQIPLMQTPSGVLPQYLIITNDRDVNGNDLEPYQEKRMTDYFQELADWKTKKGVPSVVVTIDDICANYSGNDTQEKIHNFLADVYNQYGWMNVLLGGDINIVPERMIDTNLYQAGTPNPIISFPYPSDYYYNAVGSSWDSNGNGIYGETYPGPEDNIDINTKFFLGRSPVQNCFEASVFLHKDTIYEKMSDVVNRNYVNNLAFLFGDLDDNDNKYFTTVLNTLDRNVGLLLQYDYTFIPDETIQTGIHQDNVTRWRLYEDTYRFDTVLHSSQLVLTCHSIGWENHSFPLRYTNALSSLNEGFPLSQQQRERPHLVFHIDHSSYLSLGVSSKRHNESINRTDVDSLENGPYYQILMTQGCSPGEFQKDCIVERFLNNPSGGAVAVIASSSTSFQDENSYLINLMKPLYYFNDIINGDTGSPTIYHLGAVHNHYSYNCNSFLKRKNHLFGDPELPIWTREPVDLIVSTSPSTITNQNGQLTVSVSGMAYSEYATNDVMVCVMKDDEVYLRDNYNGTAHSHNFVFDVHPETAGTLKVTVTGHNYIPYETTVPVSITGKNVFIPQKSVLDVSGNNDGKLDAGETVNLSISLKNNGTVGLANVNAVLSCEFTDATLNQNLSSYLALTTANASYGSIAKNATVTRSSYQLALTNTVPDRAVLRCTLTISDGTGVVDEKLFFLPIGAPEMEHVSVHHEVKANGKVGLDIELCNIGFGTAKGVTATLTSQDVLITQGSASYGTVSHLESKSQSFEYLPDGIPGGEAFTLTVTDAYNKSWTFGFDMNVVTDTVSNLAFESTEHTIKLKWDPVTGSRGYNVYRFQTEAGEYERLNNHPFSSSVYPDLGLGVMETYYYGVTYLDGFGNESPMAHITAWTSLPMASGWPVAIPDGMGRVWGTAPNVADVNEDGKQEVFLTTGLGDNSGSEGVVLGFDCYGGELFDIDHNPTTLSGFANLGVSMTCTPAIGDIDCDGVMEIVVATRDNLNGDHRLCVYKNRDSDNDGAPDLAWEASLEYKNFNGVVLADLDGDGTLEVIVPNQGRKNGTSYTYVEVFDCTGNYYYPKDTIKTSDPQNTDRKAVTMPVVADLDNDGTMEIVFGLESGVYKWSCSLQQKTCLTTNQSGRMDCPVVAADIDGDGTLEVLYMNIHDGRGFIRAVEPDGTLVSAWSGDTHGITLTGNDSGWEWPAYFSACDIDGDGMLEVFVADSDTLKMWNGDGTPFGTGFIVVGGLDCRYMQPLAADIDGMPGCEIVIPSGTGHIHAYKPDGQAVPGWPVCVPGLATIPLVDDLDGDGLNEMVAASQTEVYLWNTSGNSSAVPQGRFRYDRYNNACYRFPCSTGTAPLVISDTAVWMNDRLAERTIQIDSGAMLTVSSEVRFAPEAGFIVRRGGRLVLDGATLTSSCPGGMWPGIEVWGDSDAHQEEVNGSYLQGYLELKNGAVIENAVCAVNLRNPLASGTTGGIVHADGAVFRNNAEAVHMGPYIARDQYSGNIVAYNSRFSECTFTVDEDYPADSVFRRHAYLTGVSGVRFDGCSFSADRTVSGVSSECRGIDAYDARFGVHGLCSSQTLPCPPQYEVRSSFTGFDRAVYASGDGSRLAWPHIYDSDFSGNSTGVFLSHTSFATLVGNSFTVGGLGDCAVGVYADECSGLVVEENAFTGATGSTAVTHGLVVRGSASANDVYLNSYTGLDYGNLSVGRNTVPESPGGTPSAVSGLTYTCNTNSGNNVDFCICDASGTYSGIQAVQGSALLPAGNTFGGSQYHIYNDGDYVIDYYYDNGSTAQTPARLKLHRVVATATTGSNPCHSHYGSNPMKLPPEAFSELETVEEEADAAYASLRRLYDSRIDGGSTEAEMSAVASADVDADVAWRLRTRLLGLSPYLSGRVLEAAAGRYDVLGADALFEILSSNPDALRSDTLIEHIASVDGALPSYMAEALHRMAEGVTARTALRSQMSEAAHGRTEALCNMARSVLADSVFDAAAFRGLLGRLGGIDADRMAVASWMQDGDTASAFALAGTFPARYGLRGQELEDHGDYMRLLGIHRDMFKEGRTASELTSAEVSVVEGIVLRAYGAVRAMAQSLLEGSGRGRALADCPPDLMQERSDGERGVGDAMPKVVQPLGGWSVTVSPSPTSASATVTYSLPKGYTQAVLELTSALGVKVLSVVLEGNRGSKTLDLGRLAGGVYLYNVRCGDRVETGKLVVTN